MTLFIILFVLFCWGTFIYKTNIGLDLDKDKLDLKDPLACKKHDK